MRILFITHTHVGDGVMSSGLLAHLLERYPGARVTIACGAPTASLFQAVPGLDRLLVVRKKPFDLHWLWLWLRALPYCWDLVVDVRGSATAYLLFARERRIRWAIDADRHRVAELAEFFNLDPPPPPRVWLTPDHEATAARLLPAGAPLLALSPLSNSPYKEWPLDRFTDLARRLTAPDGILPDAPVVVFAKAAERPRVQPLLDALGPARVIDLVGKTSLPEAAACLRRCAFFVGNDSGMMHLAAACGTPTLGLFGPSNEARAAPWGPKGATVRAPGTRPDAAPPKVKSLVPCEAMERLDLETVQAAAEALWRHCAAPARA